MRWLLLVAAITVPFGVLAGCADSDQSASSPVTPAGTQLRTSTQESAGPQEQSYQVIERMSGPAQITVQVEAPVGATQSQMETWSKDIEAREGDTGAVLVNFYNGGKKADNLIASYQGGTLYLTR